jgi:uncharacterized Zn-binding protein involved in type VI secretion
MSRIARRGDRIEGICSHGALCCPHHVTGVFVEASGNAFAQGQGIVREGDMCRTSCPHCGAGWAHAHSNTCYVNGKPVHRLGDAVRLGGGWGRSVEASPNVHINS